MLIGLMATIQASGETFVEDGLEYTITSPSVKQVKVSNGKEIYDDLVIPEYTRHGYEVVGIMGNAFSGSYVKNVKIPTTMTSIGSEAFKGAKFLMSVSIPNSVKTIGSYAFDGCSSLTSVSIPNSVKTIGGCAFYKCASLTSVSIPNSVSVIGNYAFYLCTSLTSVSIPNSVTSIGECAFYGCTSLTSVSIPNSVTSIGGKAFSYCTSLTRAKVLTDKFSVLPNSCFYNCIELQEIELGRNLEKLGSSFNGCQNIRAAKCYTYVPPIANDDMFDAGEDLYVPVGSGDMYRGTYPWSKFRNIYETLEWSGIDGVIDDTDSPTEVGAFDIQGRPVDKDTPGMVIIKYSDGSAKKIINK